MRLNWAKEEKNYKIALLFKMFSSDKMDFWITFNMKKILKS